MNELEQIYPDETFATVDFSGQLSTGNTFDRIENHKSIEMAISKGTIASGGTTSLTLIQMRSSIGVFIELKFGKSKWLLTRICHPLSQKNHYFFENLDKTLDVYSNCKYFC